MTHESLPNGSDENGQVGMQNFKVKAGLAQMLKGGVIMDVVNVEQVINCAFLPIEFATPRN